MSKDVGSGVLPGRTPANEAAYQAVTGEKMPNYYRPPQGKFSESNLTMAKELGYHNGVFGVLPMWTGMSISSPPTKRRFPSCTKRIHPGAVVLLHSTSQTNAAILDELLTEWENAGYSFGTLEELAASFV